MDYTNKILDAAARYVVLYHKPPGKAIIPEKDYADTFGKKPAGTAQLRVTGMVSVDDFSLPVIPGKVSDVTLMNAPE